jgi:transglutaminase-like putative cysteine protease
MRLAIRHVTRYRFGRPVAHGLQRLRLRPKTSHGQQVLDWHMELEGAQFEAAYDDHHHNSTTLVSVAQGTSEMSVTCAGLVDTADNSGVVGRHTGNMPLWLFLGQTPLTKAVIDAVRYEIGTTDVETQAEEALAAGRGVCQDHAHIFIGCARALGVPARYVSGYLMMNDRIDQEAGHGWAEAHFDGIGWIGFDVSNGISPDARYVRVATGRDYREAAPVTGISWGAGDSVLSVELAVEQQLVEQ